MAEEQTGILVEEGGTPQPLPAAPPPESPAPAEPGTETPEPDADSAPAAPEEEPPVPRGIQRRIDTLTRRNYEYQRELDMLKGTVQALQRPPTPDPMPAAPSRPVRPRSEDFTSQEAYYAAEDAYIEAVADYRAEQRLTAFQAEQATKAQEAAQQQELAAAQQAVRQREAEVLQQHPDYYDRCGVVVRQLSPNLKTAIELAGTHGPDLVLHLHDHPEDIQRLNQVPWHRLGIELGLLRASANGTGAPPPARAAPRQATPKPEPPTPLSGGGRTTTPGYREDMSQAEFEAWWKQASRRR